VMGEKYVVFQIGEGHYSIPLEEVSQIIRYENVTDVPTAPHFVDGVINVGGDVIPVVSLRTRFSLQSVEVSRKNRVIIVQKQDIRYGILVDSVREILDLDQDSIAVEAASVFGMKSEFVRGIVKIRDYLIVLLDIFKVLATSPEISIKE
jgi:purine-binding chemotaxis protein CheW